MDSTELLDAYIDQEGFSFEGDSGLEGLEKVITALGYERHPFKWGDLIHVFLSDNPGAIEALLDFMREWIPRIPEWTEALEGEITSNLCPICGDPVVITGETEDGRLIASCGDAFTQEQWEEDE